MIHRFQIKFHSEQLQLIDCEAPIIAINCSVISKTLLMNAYSVHFDDCLLPQKLEMQLFLKMYEKLWDEKLVNRCINLNRD